MITTEDKTLLDQFHLALSLAYQSNRIWRFKDALRWYSRALQINRQIRSTRTAREIAPNVAAAAVNEAAMRIFCGQIFQGVTDGLLALPELQLHAKTTGRTEFKRTADWAEFIFHWHKATVFHRPLWILHRSLYEDVLYIFFRYDPNEVNYIEVNWSASEYACTVDELLPRIKHARSKTQLDRIIHSIFEKRFPRYLHTTWAKFRRQRLPADHLFQNLTRDLWRRINRPATRAELRRVVDIEAVLCAAISPLLTCAGKHHETMCLAIQAALRSAPEKEPLVPNPFRKTHYAKQTRPRPTPAPR